MTGGAVAGAAVAGGAMAGGAVAGGDGAVTGWSCGHVAAASGSRKHDPFDHIVRSDYPDGQFARAGPVVAHRLPPGRGTCRRPGSSRPSSPTFANPELPAADIVPWAPNVRSTYAV